MGAREPADDWSEGTDGAPWPLQYRTLVALSHAFEEAYVLGTGSGPRLLLALFQSADRFAVEAARYEQLAERAEVVAGFVGDPPAVPGVELVTFEAEHPLAREWSLVAVGPGCGGTLVATERTDALGDRSAGGRSFEARWSFRRSAAAREGERILAALGDRVAPDTRTAAARVLAEHATAEETPVERAQASVMEVLLHRLEIANRHPAGGARGR